MRALVTGASGGVGAVVVPELLRLGVDVRAFGRSEARIRAAGVPSSVAVVEGDATDGRGLDEALDGCEVAYFLIHSMEGGATDFSDVERRTAETFATAAQRAGVRRVVYLGGPVPPGKPLSRHLRSRLAVEEVLLDAVDEAVAFRASIVVGPRSRSFRFLVRLVERAPVLPLPRWRDGRTRPIDERDVVAYLGAAATSARVHGPLSIDVAGPDELSYGELVQTIRDELMVDRPAVRLPVSLTAVAAPVAAAIAGEDVALIGPLMESLDSDTLPRDERVRELFPEVRLHRFVAAVQRALRAWERVERLAAR
ncbi:NAD(P)H-binding protein [Conexibacter sp. SYSU D00693]|uniref:NAD(P)H-binding protein n=1 Tax=Conexibacter sp. SYSU D00693 TaxID=2812560 RepID=UPI00196ABC9F|nr:NAD(P)H-binding protein [Conexibacter sp. SYSU D00693]